MIRALAVLQQEHQNLNKLLQLMRRLSDEMLEGKHVDVKLLNEIGEYISGFPELCHHPKEDLIFRRLVDRSPDIAETGTDLLGEHQKLSELIQTFNVAIRAVNKDSDAHGRALARSMCEVVDAYEHHMEMEEQHFFPLSREKLTADDWAIVDYAISEQNDPLFDEASTRFAQLRDEIFISAKRRDESLAEAPKRRWPELGVMSSVAEINELMVSHGLAMKLVESEDGGFKLDDNGRTLMSIPACSEERAVWCTHSYILGRGFR